MTLTAGVKLRCECHEIACEVENQLRFSSKFKLIVVFNRTLLYTTRNAAARGNCQS